MRREHFMTGWMAAAVLAVATAVVSPCLAQHDNNYHPPPPHNQYRPQPLYPGPGHAGDWLRRYRNVPPWEQERALQGDPAFRRLPPERQQQLRRQLQHFS